MVHCSVCISLLLLLLLLHFDHNNANTRDNVVVRGGRCTWRLLTDDWTESELENRSCLESAGGREADANPARAQNGTRMSRLLSGPVSFDWCRLTTRSTQNQSYRLRNRYASTRAKCYYKYMSMTGTTDH